MINVSISSLWLFPAAQRKSREAPAPIKPEENKPANVDDKTAPKQSVKQNNEEKVEKPEDEKKDQEEVNAAPAVNTKKTQETEFNVKKVWLFLWWNGGRI